MKPKSKAPAAPAPARDLVAGMADLVVDTATIAVGVIDPFLGVAAHDRIQRFGLSRNTPAESEDPEERRQPQAGGRGSRSLDVSPESYDAEAHTVEVVLSVGSAVRRRWFTEELEISAEAIDLSRVNAGVCPLLDSHNRYELDAVIGRVLSARVEGDQLIGVVKFADTEAGRAIEARVASGELRALSISYHVKTWQITATTEDGHETWRAMSWELLEASFVSVPADPNAVVRSVPGIPTDHGSEEEDDMRRNLPGGAAAAAPSPTPTPTPANEQRQQPEGTPTPSPAPSNEQRQQPAVMTGEDVRTAATNAGLDTEVTMELLVRHATTPFTRDALMADIGRRFAERDSSATTVNRISVTRDAGDTMRRGMGDAIFHRMSPGSELSDVGRSYRGMSLLRMAEEFLTSEGVNVRGWSPNEIAERSLHATSDFPALMANGMNRRLRAGYAENEPSYRRWTRQAPNAPNFKSIDVVQMSALPDLLKVNEGGEVKFGTISDGIVSYVVLTYSRALGITRQTIVNDDLRALERVSTGFAAASRRLENRTVYSLLTANGNMPDNRPLFDPDHKNLAGAGAAISAATLGAGRTAMRLQKGLQEEELNLAPSWLIVPATQEQVAYQYTSSQYVPAKQADTNEFRRGGRTAVEPVVEAVLDGHSTTAWYMAASTADVDTIEWCYLEGAEGPQMSSRLGFTVDGVEVKVSLDFGAAAIDFRGLYKNPGA